MYKNKYSAQESLERIKLMMEYDTSKTATENIMEQASQKQLPADIGGVEGVKAFQIYLDHKYPTGWAVRADGSKYTVNQKPNMGYGTYGANTDRMWKGADGAAYRKQFPGTLLPPKSNTLSLTPNPLATTDTTTANDDTSTTGQVVDRTPVKSPIQNQTTAYGGPSTSTTANLNALNTPPQQTQVQPENQLEVGKGLYDGLVARAGTTGTPEEKEPYVTKNFGRIRYFGKPIQNFEALSAYITSLGYKQMKEKDGKVVWVKQ